MLDRELRYIAVSQRWRDDYRLGDQPLVGRHHYDVFPEIQTMPEWQAVHRRCLGGAVERKEEDRFVREDGRDEWMRWEIRPWYETADRVGGIMMFTEVITSRKRAEEALAKQAEELARSNAELEQFAYVASHDLQEPLRMVSSFTQLLAKRYQGKLGADADEFIGFAVEGAARMQELIRNLLDYARLGRTDQPTHPVDCAEAVRAATANLKGLLESAGATVTCEGLPTVPGHLTQVTQLFQNLIGNAIKFRGAAPPLVRLWAQDDGDRWRLAVRDNGIGIDPKHAERIFVIFQRLHARSEYPGTGIGLAICKKIVERHGGRIWVESQPGQGATIWFTLLKHRGEPIL